MDSEFIAAQAQAPAQGHTALLPWPQVFLLLVDERVSPSPPQFAPFLHTCLPPSLGSPQVPHPPSEPEMGLRYFVSTDTAQTKAVMTGDWPVGSIFLPVRQPMFEYIHPATKLQTTPNRQTTSTEPHTAATMVIYCRLPTNTGRAPRVPIQLYVTEHYYNRPYYVGYALATGNMLLMYIIRVQSGQAKSQVKPNPANPANPAQPTRTPHSHNKSILRKISIQTNQRKA